jgi:hypothetical protein
MGDAGYFALNINSLTKGNYVKTNLDAAVVDTLVVLDAYGASYDIIVFDLSSYLMFNTATDVQIRMDFYQGTSGTTSPSLPVKIDWIRSYVSKEEITGTQTAIFTPETNKTFRYYSENGALYIFSDQVQNIAIYGIEGRLIKQLQLAAGKNQVSLPHGIYIMNKQKVLVK